MGNEAAISTLNSSELVMQFRLMRALGYHSLFDPTFQAEIQNPARKVIYYKILALDDALLNQKLHDTLKPLAEYIGFFSDPELYNKIKKKEQEESLTDSTTYREQVSVHEKEYEEQLKLRESTSTKV